MAKKNAFYAQSGGVLRYQCIGLWFNRTARKHKDKIGKSMQGVMALSVHSPKT